MAIADAAGLPAAACLAGASTHEVKLAETALDNLFIPGKPEKLIGDKVYDRAATARSKKLRTEAEAASTPQESRAAFRPAAELQAAGCQI